MAPIAPTGRTAILDALTKVKGEVPAATRKNDGQNAISPKSKSPAISPTPKSPSHRCRRKASEATLPPPEATPATLAKDTPEATLAAHAEETPTALAEQVPQASPATAEEAPPAKQEPALQEHAEDPPAAHAQPAPPAHVQEAPAAHAQPAPDAHAQPAPAASAEPADAQSAPAASAETAPATALPATALPATAEKQPLTSVTKSEPPRPEGLVSKADGIADAQMAALRKRFRRSIGELCGAEIERKAAAKRPRTDSVEKCPDWIVRQMAGNPQKRKYWFELWGPDASWTNASARETVIQEEADSNDKSKAWLTYDQLVKVYQNETVASSLKRRKEVTGEWRAHPEVPDCVEATQYKCFLSEVESKRWTQIKRKEAEINADVEGASMATLMPKMMRAWLPGEAEDASESEAPCLESATPAKQNRDRSQIQTPEKAEQDSQNKQAELDAKEAAAAAKIAEANRKKQALKEKREAARASVEGKTSSWLKGVNAALSQCKEHLATLEESDKIPQNLKDTYRAKFRELDADLKKLRSEIESTADSVQMARILQSAEAATIAMKAEFKAFGAMHRGFHPKAKAAPKKTS